MLHQSAKKAVYQITFAQTLIQKNPEKGLFVRANQAISETLSRWLQRHTLLPISTAVFPQNIAVCKYWQKSTALIFAFAIEEISNVR